MKNNKTYIIMLIIKFPNKKLETDTFPILIDFNADLERPSPF